MKNILDILIILSIMSWMVGVFVFQKVGMIHNLLVVAMILLPVRIIRVNAD